MSVEAIAVSLCGGPFCGARGVVALQPAGMEVYLIRDAETHAVHGYRWTARTEKVDGEVVGWVLEHVCFVGYPAAVSPGVPLLPGVAEYFPEAGDGKEVRG